MYGNLRYMRVWLKPTDHHTCQSQMCETEDVTCDLRGFSHSTSTQLFSGLIFSFGMSTCCSKNETELNMCVCVLGGGDLGGVFMHLNGWNRHRCRINNGKQHISHTNCHLYYTKSPPFSRKHLKPVLLKTPFPRKHL